MTANAIEEGTLGNECYSKIAPQLANGYGEQSAYIAESSHSSSHHLEYADGSSFSYLHSSYYSQDMERDWNEQTTHYERVYSFNNDTSVGNFTGHNQCCEFHSTLQAREQNVNQNIVSEEMQGNYCNVPSRQFD